MDKAHPLEIPEILSLIGSFVPAWTQHSKPQFSPQDLLSCTLVSKLWRHAMLPHLWAVYDQDAMGKAHLTVVSRYSVHFRILQQSVHPTLNEQLWGTDDSGQAILKCTLLKSLSISQMPTSRELQFLSNNRGLESLKWLFFTMLPDCWDSLQESLRSFAPSLKKLCLHNAYLSHSDDLVLLLSCFPNLESLSFTQSPIMTPARYPKLDPSALADTKDRGVKMRRLKTFVVSATLLIRDPGCFLGAIFKHCPAIEQVCVDMCLPTSTSWYSSRANQMLAPSTFTWIQGTLLAWRTQYRLMNRSKEETSFSALVVPHPSGLAPEKQMDKLFIRIDANNFHPGARFHQQFERGFQDLSGLDASYHFKDERVLSVHIFQFKETLRHLSMDRLVFSHGLLSSRLLIQILRTCIVLQTLVFRAKEGFTHDQTLAIFQERHLDFWSGVQNLEAGGADATTKLWTPVELVPWACQDLESLNLGGLHHEPASRNVPDEWAIPSSSPTHQWIAMAPTKIGQNLRTLIPNHIRHLPKLKSLRLNGIAFAYSEVPGKEKS